MAKRGRKHVRGDGGGPTRRQPSSGGRRTVMPGSRAAIDDKASAVRRSRPRQPGDIRDREASGAKVRPDPKPHARPSGRPRRRLGRQSMLLFGRRAGQHEPGGASQHRRAAARLTDDVGSTVSSLQVPRRSIKTLQNLKLLPKNTFIKL